MVKTERQWHVIIWPGVTKYSDWNVCDRKTEQDRKSTTEGNSNPILKTLIVK